MRQELPFLLVGWVLMLDYMHNNPVTRGLVSSPGDWPWSSWRFYYWEDASILAWIGCIEFNLPEVPWGSQTRHVTSLRQPANPSLIAGWNFHSRGLWHPFHARFPREIASKRRGSNLRPISAPRSCKDRDTGHGAEGP